MFRKAVTSRLLSASAGPSRRFLSSASRAGSKSWYSKSTTGSHQATTTSAIFLTSALATYLGYQYHSGPVHADAEPLLSEVVISESEIVSGPVDITNDSTATATVISTGEVSTEEASSGSEAEGEGEGEQPQGAFNPDTGEINWDCPCLGGMASGPCGEEFKVAFSCFVFSEAEPKGVDCIEKFSAMQECFRRYPEVYAEELREEPPVDAVAEHEALKEAQKEEIEKTEIQKEA